MDEFTGIIWRDDTYSKQLLRVLRGIGLYGSLATLLYGIMVAFDIAPTAYFSLNGFAFFSLFLIAFATYQYFDRSPTFFRMTIRLIAFHLVIVGYAIFVTGFYSPLLIGWPILLIVAYLYFGLRALYASIALLIATAIIDFAHRDIVDPGSLQVNLIASSIVIFVGAVISWLGRVYASEHFAFQRARNNEILQRDRMISLVNSIGDAILNTDGNGVIRTYNAASLDLFDTNQSLNGQRLDDLLTLYDEKGERVKLFEAVKNSQTVTVREDLTYTFSDGEKMRLGINCSPVRSSFGERRRAQDGYIFIMRDITKAKSLEEERDEFISVVSHELRTPITIAEATVSNAQVLIDRKDSQKMMNQALKDAHDQILYLAKMVNDLSTLSRAERGVADSVEEVNIDDLLHSLYHEYYPQASIKKLQLNLDIHGKIGNLLVSRLYLEEMLQNFITNSIKYTREGSVTIAAKKSKDGSVQFSVQDTGIGISKSDQKKVFDKFYRSEDYRTRETSGTGLGLYVVSKLAEKLGTKVELKSRLNHGSTFSFSLPTKPSVKKKR